MGGIVCFVSCLLCAFPFWVIGNFGKDSKEPIVFWAGDTSLKEKIKDVKGYNREMAKLYQKCALAFVGTGALGMVFMYLGVFCIILDCTIGIYAAWKQYKKILSRYV